MRGLKSPPLPNAAITWLAFCRRRPARPWNTNRISIESTRTQNAAAEGDHLQRGDLAGIDVFRGHRDHDRAGDLPGAPAVSVLATVALDQRGRRGVGRVVTLEAPLPW
jgi:hypothetical protein